MTSASGGWVARTPMAETERRLGITPIEELLAQRDALVEEAADISAEHGPFGTWDARRKAELARIAQAIRAKLHRDGIRVTQAEVDDLAHASEEYYGLVIEATQAKAKLYKMEARIRNIDKLMARGNAIAHYVAGELRL